MDETLQELVLLAIEIAPFLAANIAVMLGNYTVIQFVAAIASNSIFVFSEASKVVYHVFIIVFTEHKEKRDPLAALALVYLIWAFIMHISWSLKSVHKALSVVWISILDFKQYFISYFGQDAPQQSKMGAEAKQTKNCTTIIIIKKIQTKEDQGEVEKPATQTRTENVYIEEVTDEIQELKKETSALRLRKPNLELEKEGQQVTKEQFKINEQKVNFPRSIMNKQNLKIDVKQQQLYTAQQKLKDDHQELNMNQEQLKNAPEEKACNTRPMDTTALNDIHQLEEQNNAQFHNTNMYTDSSKEGRPKEKACNTRPMNMTVLDGLHHLKEWLTTQLHNANIYKSINKNHKLKIEKEEQQKQFNPPQELLRYHREQIKRKGDEIVRQLQREGQLCKMNCVALAIRWICENKTEVKISGCACQLEIIITLFALGNSKLDPKDLKCGHFMERLSDVGIVKLPNDNEYVLAGEVNKKLVIVKAWEKLMTMNEKVCILGTRNPHPGFVDHVVVSDLETRTSRARDGKVMFHDPQAPQGEREAEMSLKDFIKYVHDTAGLRLYTVNLKELNRIMVYHKDELHNTEETSDNGQPQRGLVD